MPSSLTMTTPDNAATSLEHATDTGVVARVMLPVRRVVHSLSARPTLWNLFRRILEFNFREEKRVIDRELMPAAIRMRREGQHPCLLDLGCGTGELAPIFLPRGYTDVAIDIEPDRISSARQPSPPVQFPVTH